MAIRSGYRLAGTTRRAALSGAGMLGLSAIGSWQLAPPLMAAPAPELDATVPVIAAEALAARLAAPGLLLVDVRSAAEFAVSHIAGAVCIPPETEEPAVMARLGADAADATVVFYCVIGLNSQTMAQGALHDLIERGAREVLTLHNGIFAWHDAGLPLVDARGPTPYLHPHDDGLRARLRRPELARYQPRP